MREPELRACGVLLTRGTPVDSFLLMKHADRWDLPKGHVDPGETLVECALRELEEETGIPRQQVQLDSHFEFRQQYQVCYPRTGNRPLWKELVVFLGKLQGEVDIIPTEHLGFQWFDWQPPHQIQAQTIDPLLAELDRFLQSYE